MRCSYSDNSRHGLREQADKRAEFRKHQIGSQQPVCLLAKSLGVEQPDPYYGGGKPGVHFVLKGEEEYLSSPHNSRETFSCLIHISGLTEAATIWAEMPFSRLRRRTEPWTAALWSRGLLFLQYREKIGANSKSESEDEALFSNKNAWLLIKTQNKQRTAERA